MKPVSQNELLKVGTPVKVELLSKFNSKNKPVYTLHSGKIVSAKKESNFPFGFVPVHSVKLNDKANTFLPRVNYGSLYKVN